jgi:hypothetical protein
MILSFAPSQNPMLLGLGGVVAGTVRQTSTNIILSDRKAVQAEEISHGISLATIRDFSRLVVCDCLQPEDNWLQEAICRAAQQPDTHFEDFCTFIAEIAEHSRAHSHIASWKMV